MILIFIQKNKFWIAFCAIFIGFGVFFWSLFTTHYLEPKADGIYAAGSVWGDLTGHLALAMNFAEHGLLSTLSNNPIYAGTSVSYPFIADYITGLLVSGGMPVRWAFILPGFVFVMLLIWSLVFVFHRITKSRAGSLLAPVLFFINGSFWGVGYFIYDYFAGSRSFFDFLLHPTENYVALVETANIKFGNITLDYILPQRAFMFGLIVGLFVLYFLWRYWNEKRGKDLLCAAVLISTLPLLHTHSLISLVMISFFLFLGEVWTYLRAGNIEEFDKIVKRWIINFGLPMVLIAAPQLLIVFPSDKGSFIHWGSFTAGPDNMFIYWLKNLFPHILIFIAAYIVSPTKLRTFFNSFIGLFLVSNLIVFQPYSFDNFKFTIWFFIGGLMLVAVLIDKIISRFKWRGAVLAGLIVFLMTASGILGFVREYGLSWRFLSTDEVAVADFIRKNTEKLSIVLAPTTSLDIMATVAFSGRTMLHGYEGVLWSYGIDYTARRRDIGNIYANKPDALNLVKKYGVDYLIFDEKTIKDGKLNVSDLDRLYYSIFRSGPLTVYKPR